MKYPGHISFEGDTDAAHEFVLGQGWSDGLPVIVPTADRVARMIATVDRDPDAVVCTLPPSGGQATLRRIAANAVMAGCLPEYFPVVVAAVDALNEPVLNILSVNTTTNPVALMVMVNGPIRQQLGMNCASGCLGPGNRANATIGRALSLVNRNVGRALPGTGSMSTQGSPGRYSLCFGEYEEMSPWPPYHVDLGFTSEDNTVSVFPVTGTSSTSAHGTTASGLLETLSAALWWSGSQLVRYARGVWAIILNPDHARALAAAGYSKEDVKREFVERTADYPMERLGPEDRKRITDEHRDVDGKVACFPSTSHIALMVAGGPGALHDTFCPPIVVSDRPATRRIDRIRSTTT